MPNALYHTTEDSGPIVLAPSGVIAHIRGCLYLSATTSFIATGETLVQRSEYTVHVRIVSPPGVGSYREFAQLHGTTAYCAVGVNASGYAGIINSGAVRVTGTTDLRLKSYPCSIVYKMWFVTKHCGSIYVDGQLEVESIDYGTLYYPQGIISIGATSDSRTSICGLELIEAWNRLLNNEEIQYVSHNPYGTPDNPRLI